MAEERRNALPVGAEFDGYRIEAILGAGGFGITYRATETLLGRAVAIKEFLPSGIVLREADGLQVAPLGPLEAAEFEWGMGRFRAEAQTLVAFRHPNIVGVLRYFETHRTGYLVMEYVDGQTLAQKLLPDRTLTESEIHDIFDPLLNGLQAVHDQGFLHRDVKPANIFLRDDGAPVLIDFGAARQAFGQHSKSLTAIISEGYAPYEQYDSSGEQGPWTDVYAVGGVLYRCVTGIRPPDAPSRVSSMVRGRDDPMEPAATAAKRGYSAALLSAIDHALSIREDDRPQTIGDLRAAMAPPATSPLTTTPDAAPPLATPDETIFAAAPPGPAAAPAASSSPPQPGSPQAEPPLTATAFDPTPAAPPDPNETLYAGPAAAPGADAEAGKSVGPGVSRDEGGAGAAAPAPPLAATGGSRRGGVNWRIAGPVSAVVLLAAGVGTYALVGKGEPERCTTAFEQTRSAIARRDVADARVALGSATVGECAAATVHELRGRIDAVARDLKSETERKDREEKERKEKAAAERKRQAAAQQMQKAAELAAACGRIYRGGQQNHGDRRKLLGLLGEAQRLGCSTRISGFIAHLLHYRRGLEAHQRKDYGAVIQHMTQALRYRRSEGAYGMRGNAHIRRGDLQAAYQDFSAAIGVNANSDKAYAARAYVLLRMGRHAEARRDAVRALRINPNSRVAKIVMGRLNRRRGGGGGSSTY